jgi:polysaccharide chain length determinant protein (PEP-CTERM system associated)
VDLLFVISLAKATIRELHKFRYVAIIVGIVTGFTLLVLGMFWQEKYAVSTTLYADRQNIIRPLLEGQASVTDVEAQRQVVTDIMLSRRILEEIVDTLGFLKGQESAAERSQKVSDLRHKVQVKMLGANYIGVTYSDVDPQRSFSVVTKLVDFFIKESSATKRGESKQAFMFIDKQASQYKNQLREAEDKLKQFKASNLDGSEQRIEAKIEDLRTKIGDVELDLEQANVRIKSLTAQVNQEDKFLSQQAKASGYQERIAAAVAELDTLRLSLTDKHPDVISLIQHIESLHVAAEGDESELSNMITGVENPVYDELRGKLAAAKVDYQSVEKRLGSLRKRLTEERGRAKRIAVRNAELAELTRDYDVTKQLYEELLESKEKARLSMTLDIEGQGVSYKIQEPAKFPLLPSGLRYVHFVVLGMIAGIAAPLGLAVVYVLADPRIRFVSKIERIIDVPVLAEIPHLHSVQSKYRVSVQRRNMILVVLLSMGLYIGIASLFKFAGLN